MPTNSLQIQYLLMYRLYHYTLCPASRAIRITCAEKSVPFTAVIENYWEKRENFLKVNKAGSVPFLAKKAFYTENEKNSSHLLISGTSAIIEYLEEAFENVPLIFGNSGERAEIRRMCDWMNVKFYQEVMGLILNEKVINFFKTGDFPDTHVLSIANHNLISHLDYIGYLIGHSGWVSGKKFSIADIFVAANISVLDYLGIISWKKMTNGNKANIAEWYSIIKSRPSFRSILQDSVPGFNPPPYYKELDF